MWMLSRSRLENGHRSANVGDTRLEPANVFRSTKRLRGRGKAAYRHVSTKGDMTHLEMEQMRKLVRLSIKGDMTHLEMEQMRKLVRLSIKGDMTHLEMEQMRKLVKTGKKRAESESMGRFR